MSQTGSSAEGSTSPAAGEVLATRKSAADAAKKKAAVPPKRGEAGKPKGLTAQRSIDELPSLGDEGGGGRGHWRYLIGCWWYYRGCG